MKLTQHYDSKINPKYDTHDAIEVKYIAKIPKDYWDWMGVPITFLIHYNKNQFEIDKDVRPNIKGKALFRRILIRRKK